MTADCRNLLDTEWFLCRLCNDLDETIYFPFSDWRVDLYRTQGRRLMKCWGSGNVKYHQGIIVFLQVWTKEAEVCQNVLAPQSPVKFCQGLLSHCKSNGHPNCLAPNSLSSSPPQLTPVPTFICDWKLRALSTSPPIWVLSQSFAKGSWASLVLSCLPLTLSLTSSWGPLPFHKTTPPVVSSFFAFFHS